MAAHVQPLGLKGGSLDNAFEKLSALGMSCGAAGFPMLSCHLHDAEASSGCKDLSVSVFAADPSYPREHEVPDRVRGLLARTASSVMGSCMPTIASLPGTGRFEPVTEDSSTSLRQASDALAAKSSDLATLAYGLMGSMTECRKEKPAEGPRVTCSGGSELYTSACSQGQASFGAAAWQGATPHVVETTCLRGHYVPPEPDPKEHDRWAEFGVIFVAQVCAIQDPAYRSGGPFVAMVPPGIDWSRSDKSALGRCLQQRHWLSDALCKAAVQVDLQDGRQAIAFIETQKAALHDAQKVMDFYTKAADSKGEPSCPVSLEATSAR